MSLVLSPFFFLTSRVVFDRLRHLDLSAVQIQSKVGPPYDNDAFTARYGNTDDLERYTTERLRDLPGGYRELSDPFQLETLVLGCPHVPIAP